MNGSAPSPRRGEGPLLFLVAGEPSGDQLGGRLMAALKEVTGGRVRFAGVGGERMSAQGLDSLYPFADLAVMGLVEVLPRLPRLWRRLNETRRAVRALAPDGVVTIDSPGFSFRMARGLAGNGIPLIHYVAPTVWAWRPGRAKRIAAFLDHLMALLPFEPPYFEAAGLPCSFVGHPAVEAVARGAGADFRAGHDLSTGTPLLGVFPGSRRNEVARLLPVFGEAVAVVARAIPGLRVVTTTVPTVAKMVAEASRRWPAPVTLVQDESERPGALAACDAALAASGTITTELAAARTPMVVAYRMSPITIAVVRRLVRVPYVTLVNLVLGRAAIPEYLQRDCRADVLAAAARKLLVDRAARDAQIEAIGEAMRALGEGGKAPSRRAAEVVLRVLGDRSRATDGEGGRHD